jgi:PAS domain S-box-containing protein
MPDVVAAELLLDADPRHVGTARQHLRDVLRAAGLEELVEPATLAVSEVVTNAFVHTSTLVRVRVATRAGTVRVEVEDRGLHLPARRAYADTAGTGRGLQLLEECADRWGATPLTDGKVVWFEIGARPVGPGARQTVAPADDLGASRPVASSRSGQPQRVRGEAPLRVTLRQVPLLMHLAWQEHAATLLREYLLHALDEDEDILDKHAQASEALSLLNEQLPAPLLGDGPDALMAGAIEPHVSADELVLVIPPSSVPHFATMDRLLRGAISEARAGHFLSPPTQPEIDEMREWLCTEVSRQASGDRTATPWVARTDVRATLADQAQLSARYAELGTADEPLLATDDASVIVAASPAALDVLGYRALDELLGRRVLVVVPSRFHQAHIAGTTMNATNGRDNLLEIPISVPMVRADGSEILVEIEVRPESLPDGSRVFVARFRPAELPA